MPTVTLHVGNIREPIHVHKGLLDDASGFFKAACNSRFKEGDEQSMDLPEETVDDLEDFVQWLYTKRLDFPMPSVTTSLQDTFLRPQIQAIILADKFDMPGYKRAVLERVLEIAKRQGDETFRALSNHTIHYAYDNSMPHSGIRRLLVDWYIWKTPFSWYRSSANDEFLINLPEFAADIAVGFSKRVASQYPTSVFMTNTAKDYEEAKMEST